MQRVIIFALALILTTVAAMVQARADDFPSRPLRLIIGFPPGSAADITARLVGDSMSQTLGQQVVVESRPGAGSSIAAESVVRAQPDGYTLYIGTSSNLTNAAVGVGTVPHLSSELIGVRASVKLVHVPYPGSPPAVTDLIAGRVSMMFGVASTMMPHVESGRIKGLASGSAQRPHIAPNLPTMVEAGLPDFEASVWFGLMAPAGTPRAAVDKLAAAANKALKSDGVVAKLRAQGFEPLGGSPDEFTQL